MQRIYPTSISKEIDHYLMLASNGFFPLFEGDWKKHLTEYKSKKNISIKDATKNIEKIFKLMESHSQVNRKRDALNLINEEDRKVFIYSFFKLVENEKLNKLEILQ